MYAVAILLNTTLPFLHHKKERIFHRKLSNVHNTFSWTEHRLLKKFLKMSAVDSSLHVAFHRSGLKHKPTVCTPESGFLSTCLVSWRNRWLSVWQETVQWSQTWKLRTASECRRRPIDNHIVLSPALLVVSSNSYDKVCYVSSLRASPTTYWRKQGRNKGKYFWKIYSTSFKQFSWYSSIYSDG